MSEQTYQNKLPKKGEGVTATKEGLPIHCVPDGDFKGIPKFYWAHADGSRAFRKINGTITFVRPGEATQGNPAPAAKVNWPALEEAFCDEAVNKAAKREQNYTALAVQIATERYPNLSEDSQTFGMIVNAIKTHLIGLTV